MRSAGHFDGTDPEPYACLRSGHMPGARNVPSVTMSENSKLLPRDRLKVMFEAAGLDLFKLILMSCGLGIIAAVITLALQLFGHGAFRIYNCSWTEVGSCPTHFS